MFEQVFHSKREGVEDFTLAVYPDKDQYLLVTHTSLLREFDRLAPKLQICESHNIILSNEANMHYVVCYKIMSEALKVTIEGIGEATANSLLTDISRNFPLKMAVNRAKDDAILRLLMPDGLNGRAIYSDADIIQPLEATPSDTNADWSTMTQNPPPHTVPEAKRTVERARVDTIPITEADDCGLMQPADKQELFSFPLPGSDNFKTVGELFKIMKGSDQKLIMDGNMYIGQYARRKKQGEKNPQVLKICDKLERMSQLL